MDSQITAEEEFKQLLEEMAAESHPQTLLEGLELLLRLFEK